MELCRKLIGARYYIKGYEHAYGPLNTSTDYRSPRDKDGHGTHTTSTVGGRAVPHASALGGFASGTASGGAPLARLAIYKVCWPVPNKPKVDGNTCLGEDMLAALDDAVADGVDVVSISIGTSKPYPYRQDSLAIGTFHAFLKNVVVSCSAGNSGPAASTLSNTAPWIITVGASTVDRAFVSPILLGNGKKIEGQTVTPYKLAKKMYPLVYAGDIALPTVAKNVSGQCLPNSLSPSLAKGKIVLCMRGNGTRIAKGMEVKRAGGAGYVLGNSPAHGAEIPVDPHVLPATAISSDDAIKLRSYISSTKKPVAAIGLAKTVLHTKPAPSMAAFTSRGPNIIDLNILKPDITAPGVNILAAWSEAISPTKFEDDPRTVKYNILSGTSMSCPHVAAAAALLKAVHPSWSSAAIRSALMTTAGLMNNKGTELLDPYGKPATPFQFGSGHLVPTQAADPGLVYNTSTTDYLLYLCTIDPSISAPFQCPDKIPSANNLNYPSVAFPRLNGTATVTRTVTNVGGRGRSVYFLTIRQPKGFKIKISPSVLAFKKIGESKSFSVTVEVKGDAPPRPSGEYEFGWFTWSDKVHNVRSPIAIAMA
uniref:Subtilisin-like protease n=1 Tax=Kalanchoe fedtschenkoi TaxID=63787 RepID=A0A7N0REQ8_KALFE